MRLTCVEALDIPGLAPDLVALRETVQQNERDAMSDYFIGIFVPSRDSTCIIWYRCDRCPICRDGSSLERPRGQSKELGAGAAALTCAAGARKNSEQDFATALTELIRIM
jgi:hypothetical protein